MAFTGVPLIHRFLSQASSFLFKGRRKVSLERFVKISALLSLFTSLQATAGFSENVSVLYEVAARMNQRRATKETSVISKI